ncbi:hypothetical protein SAMN05421774_11139 [Gemmobacter megaterium]|uniref:Methyltransferase, FkbM family n=1 Tax=Gemmobacter megaterium TaxID=1086013 RepID=A0A1N7QHE3_9RHOB|nr:hypothetical protein [Gemmobacter megaterium]GGE26389.1 hypothetical protein GCM10011345_35410 [Gemmobacter megaterium]SIT22209.1 hypothetical protein SAMN05421774_11139 [Gemmobacter megaterium]
MTGTASSFTLLHIGTGGAGRLEDYLATAAQRIVLVEPDPAAAAALDEVAAGQPRLRVLHAGLGAQAGTAEFRMANLPELSSFHPATPDLRALFPGLRVTARHDVPMLDAAGLFGRLGGVPEALWLVLEAAGSEAAILDSLQACGAMDRVDRLELHCGEEMFFEGAQPRQVLQDRLSAAHFTLDRLDTTDPDWPVLHMRANTAQRGLVAAAARIADLESALETARTATGAATQQAQAMEARATQAETALAEAQARIAEGDRVLNDTRHHAQAMETRAAQAETALAEAEARIVERDQALDSARHDTRIAQDQAKGLEAALAETRQLIGERNRALEEAKLQLRAAQDSAAQLETTLTEAHVQVAERDRVLKDTRHHAQAMEDRAAQAETALAEAQAQIAERDRVLNDTRHHAQAMEDRAAQAETALAEAQARIAERDRVLNDTRHHAQAMETRAAQAETVLTEAQGVAESARTALATATAAQERAQADAGIALRGQLLARNDLQELQDRFARSEALCRRQDDLLRKLAARLQDAAAHLQDSAAEQAARTLPVPAATPLAAPGKTPKKKKKKS